MRKFQLLFIGGFFFFSCCVDSNTVEKKQNAILIKTKDSLENLINHSFDPIIIENNKNKVLKYGDTASFVVGLLMNDERIIDSIDMTLMKKDKFSNYTFISKNVVHPKSNRERTYGLGYFDIPNLSIGHYLFKGTLSVHGKKLAIEHYFEIKN
jgi:hypothetical protein